MKSKVEVWNVQCLVVPCNKLVLFCRELFDQEDAAALIIGVLSIAEESRFIMYPGSSKADDD